MLKSDYDVYHSVARDKAHIAMDVIEHVKDRVDGIDEMGLLKVTPMTPEEKQLRESAIEFLKAYLQKVM